MIGLRNYTSTHSRFFNEEDVVLEDERLYIVHRCCGR